MTDFGKPGSAGELPDDAQRPATPEETADALAKLKDGAAQGRLDDERKASAKRGNRTR